MHVMFEVLLLPDTRTEELLSAETLADTQARVMTREQVEQLGFVGVEDDPQGRDRCFIVIRRRDQHRIQNVLDAHPQVPGFRVHDFDL